MISEFRWVKIKRKSGSILLDNQQQEDVQNIMNQLQNNSYNKSIVRQTYISASQKDRQQIAEAVKKTEKGDDS